MVTLLYNQNLDNYKMVDIIKYLAAIMVICIHCNQLVSEEYADYFIRQVLCRIAVPFFFISNAYFIRKGCDKNPDYLIRYLKNLLKSYLAWSVVFIPIGLDWIHQNLTLSGELLPFALLFGLIHVGTYYHLWYIPAMIFSVFVTDKLLRRISYKLAFILALFLFLFGSLETYYGFLSNGWFKSLFDGIIKIIFTTRSGLFFGMIFTVIGFFIYDYHEKLKVIAKYIPWLTLLSGGFLVIEGVFLYNVTKLDMNFLLMLVPFSFFFFIWVLSCPYSPRFDTRKIRGLSKNYYFIHPICIVIMEELGKAFSLNILSSGVISFIVIFILTHILCIAISALKRPLKRLRIFAAASSGAVLTLILAGLFYQLKPEGILIKFEFVPCLWVYFSFLIYSFCSGRKTVHI